MLEQEAQEYWQRVLDGVDRPMARTMMANLDLRHTLGIPASSARGRKGKAPLLPFYEGIKHEHPTKVLLVRVRGFSPCAQPAGPQAPSLHACMGSCSRTHHCKILSCYITSAQGLG